MQRPLRRSRSFKVTDFGTNRKLIYDFLLVINTNLPCTVSELWLIRRNGQIFAIARRECLTLTLSLWLTTANIAISDISLKTTFLAYILPRKVPVYLQPLLRNPPRNLPNSVKLRSRQGYYAIQSHSRSPSLVPIQSSYATSY